MADVTIDGTIGTTTARGIFRQAWVDENTGYQFYIDSSNVLVFSKSTNGGATWGAAVNVANADAFGIWYDRWTAGDTGTKIHCVYFDVAADDVIYESIDTAGSPSDAQSGGVVVFAGATALNGIGMFCSITKARGGNLYIAFDMDAGTEVGFYRSTDGGGSWSSRDIGSPTFPLVEASGDWAILFPANAADNQDIWALYFDASADALTVKTYDDSAGTVSESSTIATVVENTTDLTGQHPFSASVRHSDGSLIISAVTELDTATADHRVIEWDGATATNLTNITTDIDDHYYPSVFIDQTTDDIYVAYNGKRDGSETLGEGSPGGSKVYYTKSTDDGATWSAGDTAYMEGTAGVVVQTMCAPMGSRFFVAWRVGTTLIGNAVNSLTFAASAVRRVVHLIVS